MLEQAPIMRNSRPNYYALLTLLNDSYDNNRVGKELFENGIVSDSYRLKIKPLYRMPIFSNFASSCPNTERLLHRIITLPTHEGLREADIKKIIETVKNITL